jgi:hypothetical protein
MCKEARIQLNCFFWNEHKHFHWSVPQSSQAHKQGAGPSVRVHVCANRATKTSSVSAYTATPAGARASLLHRVNFARL